MKRLSSVLGLMFFLLFYGLVSAVLAADELVILYTGDTVGYVDPCG